jgi:hypothetical protein
MATAAIAFRTVFCHAAGMVKRKRGKRTTSAAALSTMLAETFWYSVATIGRRSRLIAEGRCSAAEYRRMVSEKSAAAQESAAALSRLGTPGGIDAVLKPWHRRVEANARRLARKR